jgi:SAM-dependent methyltransferase
MGAREQQREDLVNFYLGETGDGSNIFDVWEGGGARGDSVTPSTYSAEYRHWMCDRLLTELARCNAGGLLSLGCGNAAVEVGVAREGYRVLGVDAIEEAVELARAKGIDALCADIMRWSPNEVWSVIYMDGVLGHLYDPQTGLQGIMRRIRSWLTPSSDSGKATFIASNDAPNNGGQAQPAPGVNGFYWLSVNYLRDQALAAGFSDVETEEFHYQRPLSGDRERSIIVAHV